MEVEVEVEVVGDGGSAAAPHVELPECLACVASACHWVVCSRCARGWFRS